jgi:hypothetical protein
MEAKTTARRDLVGTAPALAMAEMSKIAGHSWLDLAHAGEESCWPSSSSSGGAPQEGGIGLRRAATSGPPPALHPVEDSKTGEQPGQSRPQAAVHRPADGNTEAMGLRRPPNGVKAGLDRASRSKRGQV